MFLIKVWIFIYFKCHFVAIIFLSIQWSNFLDTAVYRYISYVVGKYIYSFIEFFVLSCWRKPMRCWHPVLRVVSVVVVVISVCVLEKKENHSWQRERILCTESSSSDSIDWTKLRKNKSVTTFKAYKGQILFQMPSVEIHPHCSLFIFLFFS